MNVHDILAGKGSDVTTIAPSATVAELIDVLAQRGIGAAVVSATGADIVGIVSERDVARGLHTHGAALLDMPISAVMTADVRTCRPADRIQDLARMMTDGRFRHLPVVDGGVLAGIVSLGDVVKKRIDELESEQDQLVEYLHG